LLWTEAKNSKRKEAKKIFFFHERVRNACKTDLVSLRFALKRKIFLAKAAHPSTDSLWILPSTPQCRIETPPEIGDESCLIVIGASHMCQLAEFLPE
jgi:hypothetical protein